MGIAIVEKDVSELSVIKSLWDGLREFHDTLNVTKSSGGKDAAEKGAG